VIGHGIPAAFLVGFAVGFTVGFAVGWLLRGTEE
jgi:NhaP-type Na+/H+ or K+/H+ antiporter